jgi:hypothetical protein
MSVQLRSHVRTPYGQSGEIFTVPSLTAEHQFYIDNGVLSVVDDAPEPADLPEPSDVASDDVMLSEELAAAAEEPAKKPAAKKATSKKVTGDGEG